MRYFGLAVLLKVQSAIKPPGPIINAYLFANQRLPIVYN